MKLFDNLDDLQRWFNYRFLRRTLRSGAVWTFLCGVLAAAMGDADLAGNPVDTILFLLGVFLVLEGVWILIAPMPIGLIVDGLAVSITGIAHAARYIHDFSELGSGIRFTILIVMGHLIWGVRRFSLYGRFANIAVARPSDDVLTWIDALFKRITKTGTSHASDIVILKMKSRGREEAWSGLLGPDYAIFVEDSGSFAVCARKENVEFEVLAENSEGQATAVEFRLDKELGVGIISQECMERYRRWKEGRESIPEEGVVRLADSLDPQPSCISCPADIPTSTDLSFGGVQEYVYAGFWRRVVSSLIDSAVVLLGVIAMYFIIGVGVGLVYSAFHKGSSEPLVDNKQFIGGIMVVSILFLPWLYYAIMENSMKKGTLGKMAMGIIVTDLNGKRISLCRSTGRHSIRLVPWLITGLALAVVVYLPPSRNTDQASLFLLLGAAIVWLATVVGVILVAVTPRKQGLHDLIAGSIVIRPGVKQ